jgi:hypothetical protein
MKSFFLKISLRTFIAKKAIIMQQIIETIPPNELEYEASPSIYNLVSYLPKDTPFRNLLTDVRYLLELVY